jgi:hypothetical protein
MAVYLEIKTLDMIAACGVSSCQDNIPRVIALEAIQRSWLDE